jgi:hypothetical protein
MERFVRGPSFFFLLSLPVFVDEKSLPSLWNDLNTIRPPCDISEISKPEQVLMISTENVNSLRLRPKLIPHGLTLLGGIKIARPLPALCLYQDGPRIPHRRSCLKRIILRVIGILKLSRFKVAVEPPG